MEGEIIRRARLGFYLAWIPLTGLLAALPALAGDMPWTDAIVLSVPLCSFYALVCRSSMYLCRVLPPARAGIARILLTHAAAGVAASAIWSATARVFGQVLADFQTGVSSVVPVPLLLGIGILYYLLSAAYHYLVLATVASREAEHREMQARVLARDSELRALKAQVNPHFLFNSLHSISALTTADAARARQMCILLAEFLRATLGLGERQRIALREELSLAGKYLAVEKVRFGDRMALEEEIDERCLDCQVPPLLLQPLVENAVKHGVAKLAEPGTVRLEARLDDGLLLLAVENPLDPDLPARPAGGVGLANVKQRLLAAFGEAARIRTQAGDGRYRVELLLPAGKGRGA